MFFYYLILFFVSFFAYRELHNTKGNKVFFIVIVFFLYLLSFLRWETGTDWDSYLNIYKLVEWDNMWIVEPLFGSVNVISRLLFDNYTINLCILSTILFYYQSRSILRFSPYPLISIFMLVGMQFGNVFFVRQNIAVALTMFSVYYIATKKIVPYFIFVFMAIGFHYSAIAFLPAWWVFNMEINKRRWLLLIFLSLFCSFAFASILTFLGDILGGGILYRLNFYLEEDTEANPNMSVTAIIIKALLNKGVFFLIGYYLYDLNFGRNKYLKQFFNLYCFGIVLFFLTVPISIHFSRSAWYYDINQIYLLPYLFAFVGGKKKKQLFFLLFVFLSLKLYLYILSYEDLFVPYKMVNLL